MHADEPIADGSGGERAVRLIQDANGHFYIERDGVPTEEAFHRGTRSDDVMRVEGYRPVLEVYPELHQRSPAPAGVELDEVYVPVSMPRRRSQGA